MRKETEEFDNLEREKGGDIYTEGYARFTVGIVALIILGKAFTQIWLEI
jgi:hypothetical protein